MQRIDDATAATSLPTPESAGTPGYFTEGNPTAGTPATNVRGSWLNMVQEELMAVVVAGGLTPSKTTYTQVRDAIRAMMPGRLLNIQVFKTAGTATYTPTPGMQSAIVEIVGAGGAGGGTTATATSQYSIGAPGASGSYGKVLLTAAQIGASATVTVGTGGVQAVGANGGNGGASSFGSIITTPGGGGGSVGGAVSTSTVTSNTSGAPGAVPTINAGVVLAQARGAQGIPGVGTATQAYGGTGGGSPICGGAGGGVAVGQSSVGNGGSGAGAGGSGASAGASQAALAGGAGVFGEIIVYEFGSA